MSRSRKILVPRSRSALERLRQEAAQDSEMRKRDADNGQILTRQAGEMGGKVGGPMVRKMVRAFEEGLVERERQPDQ